MWKLIGGFAGFLVGAPSAIMGLMPLVSGGCRGLGEFMMILFVGAPAGGLVGCVLGMLVGRRFDPPRGSPGRWSLSLAQLFVLVALCAVAAAATRYYFGYFF